LAVGDLCVLGSHTTTQELPGIFVKKERIKARFGTELVVKFRYFIIFSAVILIFYCKLPPSLDQSYHRKENLELHHEDYSALFRRLLSSSLLYEYIVVKSNSTGFVVLLGLCLPSFAVVVASFVCYQRPIRRVVPSTKPPLPSSLL